MRTRIRFLPVLLLVLAAFTLATLTAPAANAVRRPPPVPDIVDVGDPDEPGGSYKYTLPLSSGESTWLADSPSPTAGPSTPALEADSASFTVWHEPERQLRDILIRLLFQSPFLR